ncbi:hypothetical protein MPL1_10212 [Methylophaga lonarensis MPL]|uniref:Uncharacterized protein n=1 Tax=Methylophaga lonarensis MPL TaxID=1286106 RepID=M7PPT1_9GAMM|nr:hypothetical protein MPL1_10212 [Methylophaga lonarensis MPL]
MKTWQEVVTGIKVTVRLSRHPFAHDYCVALFVEGITILGEVRLVFARKTSRRAFRTSVQKLLNI